MVEMGESRTPRPEPFGADQLRACPLLFVNRPGEDRHPPGRSSHVSLDRACSRITRRSSELQPR